LQELGQSVWMDFISRKTIVTGELQRMVDEDGVSGITSNPTIFEKAIDEGDDYDEDLRKLLGRDAHIDSAEVFERLSVDDIRMAADVLRPVFERTREADGYVSIEVSPYLADDTLGSIAEARRLWSEVNRPNLMVKIPATPAGIPAIESLLAEGININITLMFSLAHYEAVADAFLRGAARCPLRQKIASVASIFVSRIDTMIDRTLTSIGTPQAMKLRGKIGIANAKIIYQKFHEIFYGERFAGLGKQGVRMQRVLWGSTGTKNPEYSDVLYVEELIGPDSINTMPVKTLNAFREHGKVRGATIQEGVEEARSTLKRLQELNIKPDVFGEKLQQEGVASFAASLDKLLATIEKKGHTVHT